MRCRRCIHAFYPACLASYHLLACLRACLSLYVCLCMCIPVPECYAAFGRPSRTARQNPPFGLKVRCEIIRRERVLIPDLQLLCNLPSLKAILNFIPFFSILFFWKIYLEGLYCLFAVLFVLDLAVWDDEQHNVCKRGGRRRGFMCPRLVTKNPPPPLQDLCRIVSPLRI